MHKLFFVPVLFLSVVSTAFSQRPAPTPKPVKDDDVVKISTNLIQIDVTVTDKKGKIVRDLRPEEIEIFENGQKQNVSNFSFVSNERTVAERPTRSEQPKPILPPSPVRPEQVRRSIALVVDDLSLSFESVFYARRALRKFVDEQMVEGDLVAIVRTGGGMGALQQFTNDKRQLYAAIDGVRWNPLGTGKVGTFAPIEEKVDLGIPEQRSESVRSEDGVERERESMRTSIFAAGTLGAIGYVVRGMQELPGRKSVMLISDGFKIYEEDAMGFKSSGRVLEALRRLVDLANRASVVIYTLDARGLQYTGLTAADNTAGRTSDEIESQLSDRRNQLFDTQEGLRYLADQTGGISIINNNDLSGGIRRILDDQSYYLIGYVPDDETFDAAARRFNKLVVKVNRPGVKVRYRSGFFGVSDEKLDDLRPGLTGRAKLFSALTSPFASGQVPVHLNALFSTASDGKSYIRSLLHIDLQQIKFSDLPDKRKTATIEILVVAFGDNGLVIDQSGTAYTLAFRPDQFEKYLREGLVHMITFPVKKPGAYQLRVAIRDTATDRVGSANQFIEIPNLKKDRLALSCLVLENISYEAWQSRRSASSAVAGSSAFMDTSMRRFRTGSVMNYGFSVFNAKPGSLETGNLEWQIRLFQDGKVIFEGSPQKAVADRKGPGSVDLAGSLMLGTNMLPGDYVLQITVTDKLRKPKQNTVSQFVQFEIVE